ncbi:glycosyltransferase family 2 protein [Methanobrevibacter sp.]|uniref:glycosyltransferase family 2 protein n=1 Tax=Methanobrevibacter sp. TaxID=66852 RepID=UPI0038909C74
MNLEIVVPCHNEEKNIKKFFIEINYVLRDKIDFNIIFVNDGSTDNTLDEIKKLDNVRYISFSRNFGKEAAIFAGLKHTKADYVILMDCDFQDPPSLIPEMIDYIDDYDIVATRRVSRIGEPKIRSFFARNFYKVMNRLTNIELVDGARDFRLMKRIVVDAVLDINENNRFSKGIFQWIGFNTKWIEYENIKRSEGETSWSFWRLFAYSIEGIVSFTVAPLYLSTVIGIIFSIISFIFILFVVVRTLLFGDPVSGWPSTMSVILFIGGIQLFSIGILGQYVGKTYVETKNRPKYIIKEDNFD